MRLSKDRLEQFKQQLTVEKERLEKTFDIHRKEDMALDPEDLSDEMDMTSSHLNQNLIFRIRDRERVLLKKIDKALTKLDEGSFGTCEECSDPIELKRLLARPVATLCIKCKEEEEHRETTTQSI